MTNTQNLDLGEILVDLTLNENWQKIDENVINKNGTVAFVSEQLGVDPTNPQGLATKNYVDSKGSAGSLTPNAINSGVTNSGYPSVLSFTGNLVALAAETTYTDYLKSSNTASLALNVTIPVSPVSAVWNTFIESESLVAYNNLIYKQKNEPTQLSNPLNASNTGCNISNGIATGGSGCYISLSSTVPVSTATSWEFKTKYTHVARSAIQVIITGTQDKTSPCLFITSSGILGVCLTSNATSWDIANGVATSLTMVDGYTYYIKFGFDTTNGYYVKYNTDGGSNYTVCYTNSSTTKCVCTTYPYFLNSAHSEYSSGTIDLTQTSLFVDGVCWWQAYRDIQVNDIWVDTSAEPVIQNKYNGSNWETYSGVYCGQAVTNSSGVISNVIQPEFNQNGYDVNFQTQGYRFPDLGNGIKKTVAINYVAECDGYINAYGVSSGANQWVTILINGISWQSPHSASGSNILSAWALVAKGETYSISIGIPSATVTFYPAKGVFKCI